MYAIYAGTETSFRAVCYELGLKPTGEYHYELGRLYAKYKNGVFSFCGEIVEDGMYASINGTVGWFEDGEEE